MLQLVFECDKNIAPPHLQDDKTKKLYITVHMVDDKKLVNPVATTLFRWRNVHLTIDNKYDNDDVAFSNIKYKQGKIDESSEEAKWRRNITLQISCEGLR